MRNHRATASAATVALLMGCGTSASHKPYQDPSMDFASIHTVVVMPFGNLTRDTAAGERLREVFSTMLLATGAVYVVPPGEVWRAIARLGIQDPRAPTTEEITKIGALLKADAVIRGVVSEYGEVRSGSSVSNVISMRLEMYETSTGKSVWSAASTKGGVNFGDRLFGGGGAPMNDTSEQVVDDLLNKLFR